MLRLNNTSPMTMEQIKQIAPSVFTENGSSDVSEKYSHIPTNKVIEDMSVLGWEVVDVKEVRARKNIGFQKHLVIFRHPELMINGDDGDNVYPQILLTNSHDGKNAFTFTAGLFRLVCENGLVISTKQFSDLRIRHMGYTFEQLSETINAITSNLPLTVESMNRFKQIQLVESQIEDFVKKALEVRFGDQIKDITFNLGEMIEPTRKEDEGKDMWSVFNVIQEKLIHGDFRYQMNGKERKARKIKNFKQDIDLNAKLFELAESYIN